MGIGYALSSGIQAARLAATELTADKCSADSQRMAYCADVERHVAEFLALKQGYYRAETRFAGSPFWSRRQVQLAPQPQVLEQS
ncbi:MAG: hypothetical protein ABWY06_06720 [Pseudomonas sp.]|uniref:hypothetical protein n=1 Tax=Pseudomonas sp. TaxID=306 RepID=UPI00339421B0